jgi:tRNA(Ile)-lysidine synthase
MASSRKPPKDKAGGRASVDARVDQLLASQDLKGKRVAIGLSGGVDSVVLLQVLKNLSARHGFVLHAVHVHHGLSVNADEWARHCKALCRRLKVPLELHAVKVTKAGRGHEAGAREARHRVFEHIDAEVLMLAHQLDDQAETVLHNLLRGAGLRGASGMPLTLRKHGKLLVRPMLDIPREVIVAYARAHALKWIEDETNQDQSLTRNFLRRTIGPQLAARFPRWRENLARAARHFSGNELDANRLLREFLRSKGLRAPSEAKLLEMLRQLTSGGAKVSIEHDGARLRAYRDRVFITPLEPPARFTPLKWKGERKLKIPALRGELHFRRVRGAGFALRGRTPLEVRLRAGGERLQPDPRRPRRTLKNLFQEAGVPPWQRDRLPLLFCGEELIWAPGLGIEARFRAAGKSAGWLPEWRPMAA